MSKQTEIKVEYNVPVAKKSTGGKSKYPWAKMDRVNASFLVKFEPGDNEKTKMAKATAARVTAYSWAQRHNMKFTTRIMPNGLRIWRIK